MEEGETSSSYFFRLEKKHSADRFISGLRADDGSLVACQEDLCAAFGAFYADLFSAGSVDAEAQAELSFVVCLLQCLRGSPLNGGVFCGPPGHGSLQGSW